MIIDNLRSYGRVTYNEEKGALVLGWTCSGIEIRFKGTCLKATILSNNPTEENHKAYITVITDNEKEYRVIRLDKTEAVYEICENLEDREHTVRILKRSEGCFGYAGLKELETDGEILKPIDGEFDLKIEFIGDSITCGYGNIAEANDPFSTETEDGLNAYAYIAANSLNAEANMICVSGWAAYKSPYGRSIPEIYEYADYFNDKKHNKWDFSLFTPDVVVLALGSNDNAYALCDKDKLSEFQTAYECFLKQLRSYYPQSQIICILGTLIDTNSMIFEYMQKAIDNTNDKKIHFLKLDKVNVEEDGLGSNHPTVKTHKRDAQALVNKIREIIS